MAGEDGTALVTGGSCRPDAAGDGRGWVRYGIAFVRMRITFDQHTIAAESVSLVLHALVQTLLESKGIPGIG